MNSLQASAFPVELPLAMKPYPWQLSGALRAQYAARTFGGAIIADSAGMGKRYTALLLCMMDKPAGSDSTDLIITAKSLVEYWVQEIEKCFQDGKKPKYFVLDDHSVEAMDLVSGKHDLIITTYEFVECQQAATETLDSAARSKNKTVRTLYEQANNKLDLLPGFKLALLSDYWATNQKSFRYAVFDEGHRLRKAAGRILKSSRSFHIDLT